MSFSPARPDVLALLYEQKRNYHAQLDLNEEGLSKLDKKLAKIEHVLAEKQEREMSRSEKKKLNFTKVLTRRSIFKLQAERDILRQHMDQCVSLIGSYHEQTCISPPETPWTTFWDLSQLRETSPFSSLVDSGYCEPRPLIVGSGEPSFSDLDQIFANLDNNAGCNPSAESSDMLTVSEKDEVPDLQFSSSPTTSGAQKHRRCVSADIAQVAVGSLFVPSSSKRGTSLGPGQGRNGENNGLVE